MNMRTILGKRTAAIAAFGLAAMTVQGAQAQIQTVDPDQSYQTTSTTYQSGGAIDGDLDGELPPVSSSTVSGDPYAAQPVEQTYTAPAESAQATTPSTEQVDPYYAPSTGAEVSTDAVPVAEAEASQTYQKDDLIGAAQGVFGQGAQGLAGLIEKILKDQGEPNAYIVGREAGGAFGIGVRYGSGTLHHRVEGEMPIYWTGPSIGFDVGANAASTFVLVYNLWDTEEIYERYPAGEGAAYVVGGLNASYLRKGDVVLIPIRMGVGARLGVNAGYMKFSKKQRWLPF